MISARLRLAALALVVGASSATAQSVLSRQAALADFDTLRSALAEAHGGLYRFDTRAIVDRRFETYRARITGEVSLREFTRSMALLVADLRDGHMRLEYPETTMSRFNAANVFPLRVQLEDERLIVMLNDTPTDSTIRPGMEITRINGVAASTVVGAILPTIPTDGIIETRKRTLLGRTFGMSYWLFVDTASVFTIEARDAAGKSVRTTLTGIRASDRDKSTNPVNTAMRAALARADLPNGNITLSYPRDSNAARLRIRGFNGARFDAELDSIFTLLRDRKTPSLILDLRGNGGGVDLYGARLVGRLVNKPFRYFDRIHLSSIAPSFATWKPETFAEMKRTTVPDPAGGFLGTPEMHPGIAEQQPSPLAFTGKLTVLIDGGSFSTTADVAATLRQLGRATFIGEETGGGFEGNTSGLNADVVLPNSKLKLRIQMFEYFNAVTVKARGRGTMPDITIPMRVADLLRGSDPALERALRP